jgi:hypothetical protein
MKTIEQLTGKQYSNFILINHSEKKVNEPELSKYEVRLKKIKELAEMNLAYVLRIHPDYGLIKRA